MEGSVKPKSSSSAAFFSCSETSPFAADPIIGKQHSVGGKSNGEFDRFTFEVLIHIGIGEARISPEKGASRLAATARHHRIQDALPTIGAVNIAGAQDAALQIVELVEHAQRMTTGAFVMAVSDAHLLFAVRRADARIHVEHDASRRTATMKAVDPVAGKIGESGEVLFGRKPASLEASIWLADAVPPETALPL
jgi:hypothetical protein